MTILCAIATAFLVVMVLRAIMSWFPMRPGTPWSAFFGILCDITEPALAPLRRVIPPAGPLDMSFLVLFIVVLLLRGVICRL